MRRDLPAVHGMRGDLVEPDWPPLTVAEVTDVVRRYGFDADVHLRWRSPRPMSAAALIEVGGDVLFVKRQERRVRSATDLSTVHAFAAHLRSAGVDVPEVLATRSGTTVVTSGRWLYEVHRPISGIDLYRDAMSWTPYRSADHARSAGAALAQLHQASAGFDRPAQAPGVLTDSCEIVAARDPWAALDSVIERRPGLAAYLSSRPWRTEMAASLDRWLGPASAAAQSQDPLWTHGDWHPSNLAWTSIRADAEVSGVFDLGLANRTFALRDVAVAIERAGIGWLDADTAQWSVDWTAVPDLLAGYRSVIDFGAAFGPVLADILPVVHVEYALSEIEYFATVTGAGGDADLAYYGYLLGHADWFATANGTELLDRLRRL